MIKLKFQCFEIHIGTFSSISQKHEKGQVTSFLCSTVEFSLFHACCEFSDQTSKLLFYSGFRFFVTSLSTPPQEIICQSFSFQADRYALQPGKTSPFLHSCSTLCRQACIRLAVSTLFAELIASYMPGASTWRTSLALGSRRW